MAALVSDARTKPTPAATVARDRTVTLIVGGGGLFALLLAWTWLFANFPSQLDNRYGVSHGSALLFRDVLPYPNFTLDSKTFTVAAIAILIALWVLYAVIGLALSRRDATRDISHRRRLWAGAVVAAIGLAVYMPPTLSQDIYQYVMNGRMVAHYQLNPYLALGAEIEADPVFQFVFWRGITTHYGPVWTAISAMVAWLGGGSLVATVIIFKVLAAGSHLLNAWLVDRLNRRLTGGDGLIALYLYAWNPLLLIETAGSGHNDAIMMSFALGGLLLATHNRFTGAIALITLSILVKFLTGLLAAGLGIALIARCATWGDRLRTALVYGGVATLTAALAFAPFWYGLDSLIGPLAHAAGAPSVGFVRVALREFLAQWWFAGQGAEAGRQLAEAAAARIVYLFFALVVAIGLWRVWRDPRLGELMDQWGIASLFYLAVVYSWNFPWYLVSTLATTIPAPPSGARNRLLVWTCVLGSALMLIYALVTTP